MNFKNKSKIFLIFANFGPYHLARLDATRREALNHGVEVWGLELAGNEEIYPWEKPTNLFPKITLFPSLAVEKVSTPRSFANMLQVLNRHRPDILAISGYDRPAMLTALAWAKLHGKIAILMSETKGDDQPRKIWKEWLKRKIVSCFDSALVGGTPQKEYAVSLGLSSQRVFTGYDVVDVEYYDRRAARVQAQEDDYRKKMRLPRSFFLTACRLIDKKNLFRLLDAYRIYRSFSHRNPWGLVICGTGILEEKLKQASSKLSDVYFLGYKQAEELSVYYGLASTFILASYHFEQWGLVVNEAMAARLPVLVSRACGCTIDLVQDGVNGFTFDPYDVEGMARLMVKMSSGEVDLQAMGKASRRIIANWTPEVFADNLFKAVAAAKTA
jgi:glycosyltransferase involved in cell wall biosynthesis